jgi:hypothetical protein
MKSLSGLFLAQFVAPGFTDTGADMSEDKPRAEMLRDMIFSKASVFKDQRGALTGFKNRRGIENET